MRTPVTHFDPSHHHLPKTNWQRLGELKLRAGSNPDGMIDRWLMVILRELSLPDDLVSRLRVSIEEATARSSGIIEGQFEYLEIRVLIPTGPASGGHTWGFFRIERAATDAQIESTKGHCVEYYLYSDKKTEE